MKCNFDFSEIKQTLEELSKFSENQKEIMDKLAAETHAFIMNLANSELNSSKNKYLDNLELIEENGVKIIVLREPAMWIEEGKKQGSMVPGFMDSDKAKTGKDGKKYLVIPFEHSKNSQDQNSKAKSLTDSIKVEMKQRGIEWGGIQKTKKGKEIKGLTNSFNVSLKNASNEKSASYLRGVRVYQSRDKKTKKMQQSVMTFRIAKEDSDGWIHPGTEAVDFFEKAMDYIDERIMELIIEFQSK
jgi:truncated hemoglobin YjbI